MLQPIQLTSFDAPAAIAAVNTLDDRLVGKIQLFGWPSVQYTIDFTTA
jgi:hypothetical protein